MYESARSRRNRATYATSLDFGDEDEHKLVFVYPGANPHDYRTSHGDERCERCKDQTDGAHEQLCMARAVNKACLAQARKELTMLELRAHESKTHVQEKGRG